MTHSKQTINNDSTGIQAGTVSVMNVGIPSTSAVEGIPKQLTLLPAKNPNFVGREKELAQIKQDLEQDGQVYIVNGIGGIGKSELAYQYLLQQQEHYQHIALFRFSENSDSLKNTLVQALSTSLFIARKADELNLQDILYRLQTLQEKCLLVFDDIKNLQDVEALQCLNTNCDVLITTRLHIAGQSCLNLDILSLQDARKLFQQHYVTNENIDDILEYIDYHSLFIELIAKTLNENCLSLKELRDKFKKGEFSSIDRDFDASFNDFLIKVFQIEEHQALKELLQWLALLPSIEISIDTLEEIFSHDSRLKLKLNELVKRGWLIKKQGSYKLHQIIKEFILANHQQFQT
jgi:hypothetical protein